MEMERIFPLGFYPLLGLLKSTSRMKAWHFRVYQSSNTPETPTQPAGDV